MTITFDWIDRFSKFKNSQKGNPTIFVTFEENPTKIRHDFLNPSDNRIYPTAGSTVNTIIY